MSLEKAKAYLENKGFLDHVIELADSTATVAMAAEALGVEPGMIAKTMSFLQGEQAVLILTEGTAKVACIYIIFQCFLVHYACILI